MKKVKIEEMEYIVRDMKYAQREHPKATIYYDWESHEIRVTYPLPKDFHAFNSSTGEEN